MKAWICFILCISMTVVLLAGCSHDPSNMLSQQKSTKDIEKTNFQQVSTVYDKSKINKDIVKRNSDFAFDIFKQLNRKERNENIFISPLSISTALTIITVPKVLLRKPWLKL